MASTTVQWTGKNTAEIKQWILHQLLKHELDSPKIAMFVKRRGNGVSETLWQNIADEDWPKEVTAAVYNYGKQAYVPLLDGWFIYAGDIGEFDTMLKIDVKRPTDG